MFEKIKIAFARKKVENASAIVVDAMVSGMQTRIEHVPELLGACVSFAMKEENKQLITEAQVLVIALRDISKELGKRALKDEELSKVWKSFTTALAKADKDGIKAGERMAKELKPLFDQLKK